MVTFAWSPFPFRNYQEAVWDFPPLKTFGKVPLDDGIVIATGYKPPVESDIQAGALDLLAVGWHAVQGKPQLAYLTIYLAERQPTMTCQRWITSVWASCPQCKGDHGYGSNRIDYTPDLSQCNHSICNWRGVPDELEQTVAMKRDGSKLTMRQLRDLLAQQSRVRDLTFAQWEFNRLPIAKQ